MFANTHRKDLSFAVSYPNSAARALICGDKLSPHSITTHSPVGTPEPTMDIDDPVSVGNTPSPPRSKRRVRRRLDAFDFLYP
jgi:hypothetical protein